MLKDGKGYSKMQNKTRKEGSEELGVSEWFETRRLERLSGCELRPEEETRGVRPAAFRGKKSYLSGKSLHLQMS